MAKMIIGLSHHVAIGAPDVMIKIVNICFLII